MFPEILFIYAYIYDTSMLRTLIHVLAWIIKGLIIRQTRLRCHLFLFNDLC